MNDEIEIILQPSEVDITTPLVADYVLPKATANVLGGVKIGANVNVSSDGTISIPTASANTGGVVKVGNNLSIDENGVLSASTSYTLPQATKTTLGGVYVDDALNGDSVNPVQNSVVTTQIGNVASDLSSLSDTVGDIDDEVDTLTGTVSGLSHDLGDLSGAVSTNTTNIGINTGAISSLTNQVGSLSDDVTTLGNSVGDLTNNVSAALYAYNETILYNETNNGTWNEGQVRINRRGNVGTITSTLKGTASALTVPANDEVIIATMTNSNEFPDYVSYASISVGDGQFLQCRIDTYGQFVIENNTSTSMTVDRVIGTIPIIFA